MGGDIIRAKHFGKPVNKERLGIRTRRKHDPAAGIFLGDLRHFGGGKVQSLVPGNPFPFAFSTLAFSKQRVFEAIWII